MTDPHGSKYIILFSHYSPWCPSAPHRNSVLALRGYHVNHSSSFINNVIAMIAIVAI